MSSQKQFHSSKYSSLKFQGKRSIVRSTHKKYTLTEEETTFLDTHFKNYKDILQQWVNQESKKYNPKSNKTFPMLTLPELKDNDQEDKIKIYLKWQEIVNRLMIRS